MSNRQAKRARFYAAQKRSRVIWRIHRANKANPNYAGAVQGLTLRSASGEIVRLGPGALFIGDR